MGQAIELFTSGFSVLLDDGQQFRVLFAGGRTWQIPHGYLTTPQLASMLMRCGFSSCTVAGAIRAASKYFGQS